MLILCEKKEDFLLPLKHKKRRTEFETLCDDVFMCRYDDPSFYIDEPKYPVETKKFNKEIKPAKKGKKVH